MVWGLEPVAFAISYIAVPFLRFVLRHGLPKFPSLDLKLPQPLRVLGLQVCILYLRAAWYCAHPRWRENPGDTVFGCVQVLHRLSGPILRLAEPGGLWESDPGNAVSMSGHMRHPPSSPGS